MSAHVRQAAGTGRAPRWRVIGASLAAAAMLASLAACSSATTSPSGSGPVGSGAAPVDTLTPTPAAYADTLRVGWSWEPRWNYRGLDLNAVSSFLSFRLLVYSRLYRYDANYSAIPDLADGPCFVPGADARVIRCRIVATTFHDGTPLTADDVAYTYRLFALPDWCEYWVRCTIEEVRVVDPRTVDFVLSSVDPTFLTLGVTNAPIFSRREVEAKYAAFAAAAKGLTADGVQALVDAIGEETGGDPAICSDARLGQVDALLARLGAHLWREDYRTATGALDPCAYLAVAADELQRVASALGREGLEAVMQALVFFSTFQLLSGTGPYRYVSQDADHIRLEAFAGYHGGVAATRYVDFVPTKGDGSDVAAGTVDISENASLDTAYRAAAAHGVQVYDMQQPVFVSLTFNVRPGRLFRRRQPATRAPALHRPPARRRRRDRGKRDPRLQPRLAGRQLGRRPRPAEAGPRRRRREAPHRGVGLDARVGRRLRQGRGPPRRQDPRQGRRRRAGQAGRPRRAPGRRLRDGPPEQSFRLRQVHRRPHDLPP